MSIVKWNPFREMVALHEDMDRLFSRLDGGAREIEASGGQNWMLAMDVVETADAIKLKAALPGIEPENIQIQVENNVLTVNGERRFEDKVENGKYTWLEQRYGSFSRSVTLPHWADTERIEAGYRHGVLELTVPRREESKPRRIELNLGRAENEPKAIEAESSTTSAPKS
ncbi:MAG TPA: Hsp20/alpha crystallin family protein [Abditibacteriaceae bacterium]|jgi:HSP20 family protein